MLKVHLKNSSDIIKLLYPAYPQPANSITFETSADIDTSEFPYPQSIWTIRPWAELALKVFALATIGLLAIAANAGLARAILRRRGRLRLSSAELLVLSAALADLGTGLCCPWLFAGVDLFQAYVLGPLGCRLDGFLQHALTLAALFSLSALSYDRLRCLDTCAGRLSLRRAKLLALFSWLAALGLAGPLAFGRRYYERQWIDYLETFCAEDRLIFPYWHVFVGLGVCAPLILMAVCYSIILIKLSRYAARARQSEHPITIAVKYKDKVARLLGLVVLAFILCRVPFTLLVVQRARMTSEDSMIGQAYSVYWLWWLSRYLVLVNAAINPLLYGCTSSSLRRELATYPVFAWIISESHRRSPRVASPRPSCIKMPQANELQLNVTSLGQDSSQESKPRHCKRLRFSPTLVFNSWDRRQKRSANLKF